MTTFRLAAEGEQDGGFSLDPAGRIVDSLEGILEGLFGVLPNLLIAVVVVAVAWVAARLVRSALRPRLVAARTRSFGRVFANLAGTAVLVAGVLVAVPIAFPSIDAMGVLAGLGLLGVAAGFAFQDILSNLLAGILLILRQPFEAGDQIAVAGISGTVQVITIRETELRTFDGRDVYVPNTDVYQGAITVQTGQPAVRTSLLVGVSYDDDLAAARRVALDTLGGLEGIRDEPAPQALYTEFGGSSITLDLRYWTGSSQAEIRRVQDRAVEAVKAAFDEAGVDIPFEIVTLDTLPSFDRAVGAETSASA